MKYTRPAILLALAIGSVASALPIHESSVAAASSGQTSITLLPTLALAHSAPRPVAAVAQAWEPL